MPILLENDGSAEYLGAVLYADAQRWTQALDLAVDQLGIPPDPQEDWFGHLDYSADLRKLARKIVRRMV